MVCICKFVFCFILNCSVWCYLFISVNKQTTNVGQQLPRYHLQVQTGHCPCGWVLPSKGSSLDHLPAQAVDECPVPGGQELPQQPAPQGHLGAVVGDAELADPDQLVQAPAYTQKSPFILTASISFLSLFHLFSTSSFLVLLCSP